jgi:hypothetical protein
MLYFSNVSTKLYNRCHRCLIFNCCDKMSKIVTWIELFTTRYLLLKWIFLYSNNCFQFSKCFLPFHFVFPFECPELSEWHGMTTFNLSVALYVLWRCLLSKVPSSNTIIPILNSLPRATDTALKNKRCYAVAPQHTE